MNKDVPEIVDGIWVTGKYWGSDSNENTVYIPSSGIKIAEIAEELGGWAQIRSNCANCEANVATPPNVKTSDLPVAANSKPQSLVGGCHGTLEVMYPQSGSLDELFWRVIQRHDLEGQLREAFQLTDPLWFGFWMDSPLNRQQCKSLLALLSRALPLLWEKDPSDPISDPVFGDVQFAFSDFNPAESYGKEYAAFFRALEASINYDLPLHVHLPPPGHTDMGCYTIFAHCPRCKASADVPRWGEVQSETYSCKVCQNEFDPASTASSESDDFDFDRGSLEKLLGDQYDPFVVSFGKKFGHPKEQMLDALDVHRDGPNKRKIQETRKRVKANLRQYSQKTLTSDFQRLRKEIVLELAPGVAIEFVLAPSGEFRMGEMPSVNEMKELGLAEAKLDDIINGKYDPESDEVVDSISWCSSVPVHTVNIKHPFYVAKFPVTQEQWEAIMGNNPSQCRFPNHPVEQVDWFTAQEFCLSVSERLDRAVRLPSEAEWEYACRAGTTTRSYCGESVDQKNANLVHDVDSENYLSGGKSKAQTTPVDQFPANPWGIHDMLGNVYEWCDDSWHENYKNAPTDGSAWIDEPERLEHSARGSAAYVIASRCSSGGRSFQRANCGAKPWAEEDGESDLEIHFGFGPEFFGLRLFCEPIEEDLND